MNATSKQLDQAIAAHARWKQRLRDLVQGAMLDIAPEAATRDDVCELGKWLRDYYRSQVDRDVVSSVRVKHRNFHLAEGKIVALLNAKQHSAAEREIGLGSDYAHASAALTADIMEWKKLPG